MNVAGMVPALKGGSMEPTTPEKTQKTTGRHAVVGELTGFRALVGEVEVTNDRGDITTCTHVSRELMAALAPLVLHQVCLVGFATWGKRTKPIDFRPVQALEFGESAQDPAAATDAGVKAAIEAHNACARGR